MIDTPMDALAACKGEDAIRAQLARMSGDDIVHFLAGIFGARFQEYLGGRKLSTLSYAAVEVALVAQILLVLQHLAAHPEKLAKYRT